MCKLDMSTFSNVLSSIGSSLSASHDGDGNGCSGNDDYIMASGVGVPDNTNPWKFSTCSINYFTTYIDSLNS